MGTEEKKSKIFLLDAYICSFDSQQSGEIEALISKHLPCQKGI